MFQDGNKRVANLVANKEMIKNGLGILNIPVEFIGKYFTYLIHRTLLAPSLVVLLLRNGVF